MIPILTILETEYYVTDSIQHKNEYREVFGVRVAGLYAPTLTAEEKTQM